MGMNTVVVMLNDRMNDWPEDMKLAMSRNYANDGNGEFRGGEVISTKHADDIQIVAVSRNSGELLTTNKHVEPESLNAMASILRAHGYSIMEPEGTDLKEPYAWGYAAKKGE